MSYLKVTTQAAALLAPLLAPSSLVILGYAQPHCATSGASDNPSCCPVCTLASPSLTIWGRHPPQRRARPRWRPAAPGRASPRSARCGGRWPAPRQRAAARPPSRAALCAHCGACCSAVCGSAATAGASPPVCCACWHSAASVVSVGGVCGARPALYRGCSRVKGCRTARPRCGTRTPLLQGASASASTAALGQQLAGR